MSSPRGGTHWRTWAVGFLLAMGGVSAWCGEAVALQLPRPHQFRFAGYYVAIERGFYREAGLDVEIRSGGIAALHSVDAVLQQRAEFGVGTAGLAIDRMNGRSVVALAAILQSSPAVWLAAGQRNGRDLSQWSDLPRRLTGRPEDESELLIPFSALGKPAAAEAADQATRDEVTLSVPPTGLRAADLSTGARHLARRDGGDASYSILDPRDHGVNFYGEVLFTSEAFLKSRPGTVHRFREATLRGWEAALADVEATARLIQRRYAPTQSLGDLVDEGLVVRRLARIDEVAMGHMSRLRWQAIGQLQRTHGFGRDPLDVNAFVRDEEPNPVNLKPDPIRITFAAVLVALLFGAVQLLRVNGRLLRENRALNESSRERRTEEMRFQFLMDVAPFPVTIYALSDGRIRYANDQALGWSRVVDLVDVPIQAWIPELAPAEPLGQRLANGRALREQEIELPVDAEGVRRWCSVTGRGIEYDGDHCALVAISDITARKAALRDVEMLSEQRALILQDVEILQARLREASLRDALTGLFNRRYFDVTLEREFARCSRERKSIGLMVVDADHFKKINDRFGHAGGDEVLRALGALLASTFRTEDVVCRYGGEEFVVLLPGAEAHVALTRAEALRQAAADTEVTASGESIRFGVSIGLAIGDLRSEKPQELFARADAAVYAAKGAGRNCVRMAPPVAAAVQPCADENPA